MSDRGVPLNPTRCCFVVIEDDTLLSNLLCLALTKHFNPGELHAFTHGRAGIAFCRDRKPELIIVDLGLPDVDGRAVIRDLLSSSPDTRVMVLTGTSSPSLPGELISLGVCGYVDKGSPLESITAAVQRVLDGGMHFSAATRPRPARTLLAKNDESAGLPPEVLTPREREIARLVASGLVSKEIAAQLNLSRRTVENIRAQILAKLHLRDVPGLVRWCVKHGLA